MIVNAVKKMCKGFPLASAQEYKSGVRSQIKGLFPEAVEIKVHVNQSGMNRRSDSKIADSGIIVKLMRRSSTSVRQFSEKYSMSIAILGSFFLDIGVPFFDIFDSPKTSLVISKMGLE